MIPKEPIKYQQAKKLLQRAVEEKGADYSYQQPTFGDGCVYFNEECDNRPSCIVGHAISYLGVTREDLLIDGCDLNADTGVDDLSVYIPMTEKARKLLTQAQSSQDRHEPWGESVDHAIRFVEE